jgi:hypothetical protein
MVKSENVRSPKDVGEQPQISPIKRSARMSHVSIYCTADSPRRRKAYRQKRQNYHIVDSYIFKSYIVILLVIFDCLPTGF